MRRKLNNLIVLTLVTAAMVACSSKPQLPSNKQERNYVRAGNKHEDKKQYAEAEVDYRKALQANPASGMGGFNLGTVLARQGNPIAAQQTSDGENNQNDPISQAEQTLASVAKNCPDKRLSGNASYDLGNIAYAKQQYAQAIEHYKNALRQDPNDDQARDNLRMAQLKKQEQDQNQNKDQNKNQNKDQNQDQNQNKDQNKDKDQDKDQDQNQNKDQNKDQDQQNNQQNEPQQQPQRVA